ncbi:thiol-disulfide oxidoreductase DCC family protein [Streptomyces roseolus]|uniref:thiol-disulfide oxidoreductase DCC family protein n=1 Tax=Streptomyces roseolus TaxID=67358 RepID=UPI00365C1A8F
MRSRPVLVYDGDCGFCTTAANFAERRVRPRCEIVPWQFTDLDALGVTPERAAYEVLWVTPSGAVDGGARAVAKALLSAGGVWAPLGAVLLLPGVGGGAPGGEPGGAAPPPPPAGGTPPPAR